MTKREQALAALFERLGAVAGPEKLRNAAAPEAVPAQGLIIMRDDGIDKRPDPEASLSPVVYSVTHIAGLEIYVERGEGSNRDAQLDALLAAVGEALDQDRTLAGAIDYARALSPQTDDLYTAGSATTKAALVPIELTYDTPDLLV